MRKRPASPPDPQRSRLGNVASIGLLIAVITRAYLPLFSNGFIVFDDPVYITRNPHIQSGLTFDTWKWALSSTDAANWHPLTWIVHALNVDLFGMNAGGHHFTSLFIHVLNAVLLYLLLSQITPYKGRCLVSAALFALHPLAVESVGWAAELKSLLCTFFFLLAIAAYGWYAVRPRPIRYVVLIVTFALALCSKPMAITLPFVLLLLDFWPLGRVKGLSSANSVFSGRTSPVVQLVLEKIPLLMLSIGSAIVTIVAQSSGGAVDPLSVVPLPARLSNGVYSYLVYIIKAFWPAGLAPYYPLAPVSAGHVALASLFLAATTVIVWWQRAARPYLIAGWLFYVSTLIPVIGLIQVGGQARADRYTYVPMIGIFVAIIWLAGDFAVSRKLRPALQTAMSAAILAVLAILTWRQASLWRDDMTLWSYTLEATDNNFMAEDNLGLALLSQGKVQEALPHFYRAQSLNPDDLVSTVDVATDLLAHGRAQEAIAKYEIALRRAAFVPMMLPNIHSNLGSAFLSVGNVEQARSHFEIALRLDHDDALAKSGLQKIEQQENH
jgi:tetratricopeptide (TPR) repeat protein